MDEKSTKISKEEFLAKIDVYKEVYGYTEETVEFLKNFYDSKRNKHDWTDPKEWAKYKEEELSVITVCKFNYPEEELEKNPWLRRKKPDEL